MWFKIQNQHVTINVFAKPNAKKTALLEINEQGMQISLHAKPYQGEANKALIGYLSELFHVPQKHIHLKRGDASRYKQVTLPLNKVIAAFLDEPKKFITTK